MCAEYDALRRMGIDAPEAYASKYYTDGSKGSVERLTTCVVGGAYLMEWEGAVEDLLSDESDWMDSLVSVVCSSPLHTAELHT